MSRNQLFKRKAIVRIGPAIVINRDSFKFTFEVPFDDDTEPNEIKVEIYNLSRETIAAIRKNDKLTIEAGYVSDDTGIICSGRVTKFTTSTSGLDKITTVYAIDSQDLDEKTIASKTYASGTKASYILKDLAGKLGIPIAIIDIEQDVTYPQGWTVDGKITDEMQKVAVHCGVSVYVNKGYLYVRSLDDGDDAYFELSVETGLLDSPEEFYEEEEITEEDQKYVTTKKGKRKLKKVKDKTVVEVHGYKCKCLLQHRITTASIIDLKSKEANGKYRVRNGTHKFDTDFVTEFECVDSQG